MNIAQETPASTEDETVPGYRHWCPECYYASIERLCRGFTISHNRLNFPPSIVPPLAPGTALSLRGERDQVIARRADWKSEAAQHHQHPQARH